MGKRVIFTLLDGSLAQGFPVVLRIWDDDAPPNAELQIYGQLPPSPKISTSLSKWQQDFHHRVENLPSHQFRSHRATARRKGQSFSDSSARQLKNDLNQWLNSGLLEWKIIRDSLQQHLSLDDEIRVILQTQALQLRQLPWQAWELFDTHYSKAEIALGATKYQSSGKIPVATKKVRILAVLGNSHNINIQFDRQVLERLQAQGAEIKFLQKPSKKHLIEQLWDEKGWHIFFFAGHSFTGEDGIGWFEINQGESLEIDELKNALSKAIECGLQLAIFNSCDGLGLANQLAYLHLPQSLVMREPVPDSVAQEFLRHFLTAFAGGKSLYAAVREARKKLEDNWNKDYPGVSWLPVICQNSPDLPLTWKQLQYQTDNPALPAIEAPKKHLAARIFSHPVLIASLAVTALVLGVRHQGWLQRLELPAFDQMLLLRADDKPDPRILVITIDRADLQYQDSMGMERKGSLSDAALTQVLDKLEPHQPRVIGLDIFHDFPFSHQQARLASRLRDQGNFIAVCKHNLGDEGVQPPPGVPQDQDRLGFADLAVDNDSVIRRHLLAVADYRNSPCSTQISLSLRLALRYLMLEGLDIQLHRTSDGNLQLVNTKLKLLKGNAVGYQQLGGEQMLLNYRTRDPQKVASTVTLTKILTGDFNPKLLEDRIVLIGVIDPSVRDLHYTPYSIIGQPNQEMPGVFVQAQMVSQLVGAVLDRRPLLGVLPVWGDAVLIWGSSLVGGAIAWRIRSRLYLGVAVATVIVTLSSISFVFFVVESTLVPLVPSALALVATVGSVLVYQKF